MTTTSAPTHLTEKITVTGLEMRYLKKGSGKPLVVLHHSISNHGWLPLYERLSRTFTVYVPDLPGFGESARPEWDSVRDEAIQVQFMLDRLGLDRVTLVGFGFGGFLAAEMATMNQHRLERLVLVGAAGIQPARVRARSLTNSRSTTSTTCSWVFMTRTSSKRRSARTRQSTPACCSTAGAR